MNEKMFIWTQNKNVAEELKKSGFEEIQTRNLNMYVFLNNISIELPISVDKSEIYYSNKLCI